MFLIFERISRYNPVWAVYLPQGGNEGGKIILYIKKGINYF